MKTFRIWLDWGLWGFHLYDTWYDGPYWDLQFGPLCAVWNRHGLPYIFQD